ncbi:hypothetical protein RCH11_003419, partial [Glaciihabitans sp. GrIS 2.15]|nr:hypothetical protein [Glaciihabitans sp. GrIS 2.15]
QYAYSWESSRDTVVVVATGAAVHNPNKLDVCRDRRTGLTIADHSLAHALNHVEMLFRS